MDGQYFLIHWTSFVITCPTGIPSNLRSERSEPCVTRHSISFTRRRREPVGRYTTGDTGRAGPFIHDSRVSAVGSRSLPACLTQSLRSFTRYTPILRAKPSGPLRGEVRGVESSERRVGSLLPCLRPWPRGRTTSERMHSE